MSIIEILGFVVQLKFHLVSLFLNSLKFTTLTNFALYTICNVITCPISIMS